MEYPFDFRVLRGYGMTKIGKQLRIWKHFRYTKCKIIQLLKVVMNDTFNNSYYSYSAIFLYRVGDNLDRVLRRGIFISF